MKFFESKFADKKQDTVDNLSTITRLLQNDLFKGSNLSQQDFDDLRLNIIVVKKGDILFRQGDSAISLYLVLDGEINLIKKQTFGKTHSCLTKNNFFGHEELFMQVERTSIAIALKDSRLVELSKENIEVLLSKDTSLLSNVKNSIRNLDSNTIVKFEQAIAGIPKISEAMDSELEQGANISSGDDYGNHDDISTTENSFTKTNKKMDRNAIKSEKSLINFINENLTILEEEKEKLREVISNYKDENKKLQSEIEKLKKQELRLTNLDKEKTEILGRQSYRIVELEKETVKFEELENGFLKNIEHINEQAAKDKTRIKKLSAELDEKDEIISKYESEYKDNKKIFLGLNENQLQLTQKLNDQERIINEQIIQLKNSDARVEDLSKKLSDKEVTITELNKDLINKNQILISQSDAANRINSDVVSLRKTLEEKEATLNNHLKEIKNLSDVLKQKDVEIAEYSRTLDSLKDEIADLKKKNDDNAGKGNEYQRNIFNLESQLSQANGELISLSDRLEEKLKLLESKEKEKADFQKRLAEEQESLKKKNQKVADLNNTIMLLNNELSDSQKLNEDFNAVKMELFIKTNQYDELKNDNLRLTEQIRVLNLKIEKNAGDNSIVTSLKDEVEKLKSSEELFKSSIIERDKIISDQRAQVEEIRNSNLKESKNIASLKKSFEADISKKEAYIKDLTNQLKELQTKLEENALSEEQQAEIIENQLQKIVQLELSINELTPKRIEQQVNKEEKKERVELKTKKTEEDEPLKQNGNILSKAELIATKYVDSPIPDEGFQYYQYSDIHIINVNLTRATMDSVTECSRLLQKVIGKGDKKIVINLSQCEYIDSSFLGLLVSSLKKVSTKGGDLRLAGLQQSVHSMMELTKLYRIFESFPTLEKAVESYMK